MTINIFVLKGDLNGENRSGAFLFLLGIYQNPFNIVVISVFFQFLIIVILVHRFYVV